MFDSEWIDRLIIGLLVLISLLNILSSLYIIQKFVNFESEFDNSNKVNYSAISSFEDSTLAKFKNIDEKISNIETFVEANNSLLNVDLNDLFKNISSLELIDSYLNEIHSEPEKVAGIINSTNEASVTSFNLENPVIAKQAFRLASDESINSDYRNSYYIYAIIRNPFEAQYYESYFEYLDEANAPSESYYYIITLLDNFISNYDLDRLSILVDIQEIAIDKYLMVIEVEEKIAAQDAEKFENTMHESWNILFNQFLSLSNNFDKDLLEASYSSLSELYSLISNSEGIIDEQYELMNNIVLLYSTYLQANNLFDNLQTSDDSIFIDLFENSSTTWSSLISVYNNRDKNNESSYQELIGTWLKDILNMKSIANNRYNDILYNLCNKEILIAKKIISQSIYTLEKSIALDNLDEKISSYIGKINNNNYTTKLYESYNEVKNIVYQAQFTDYQIFVANKLVEIDSKLAEADKDERLEVLFKNEYFNIERSLLINELLKVYDNLNSDAIIAKSEKTISTLLEYYPIKKIALGDV